MQTSGTGAAQDTAKAAAIIKADTNISKTGRRLEMLEEDWRCWKKTGEAGDTLNTGEAGWGSWKVCSGQSSAPLKDTELL